MSVYLNGRFLTQPMTGVQRFAHEMGSRLVSLLPDMEVLAPRGDWDLSHWPGPVTQIGRLNGHFWEQIDLPRHLHARGRPLLLNFTNSGPAYYGNQISTQHDINYVRHPDSYSPAFRRVYSWLGPRLVGHSRVLLTGTEHAKQDLISHFRPKVPIHVVYDAASPMFTPGAVDRTADQPFLLAVASTSAHKNLGRLYEAMSRLRGAAVPPLWVVGSGGKTFTQAGRPAEVDSTMVRFLGRVSDEELVRLYRRATAFVFPSLHEGFGLPPVEAQASGCPVIASSASCIPEVLGDSFQPFDPLDVDSIVGAIKVVTGSAEIRGRLREAGFRNVSRYSWDRSAAEVAELVGQLA